MDIVLHDQTRNDVEAFINQPVHSLLISAPMGSGKLYLARNIAARLIGIKQAKLTNYPYFFHITKTGQSITVDTIRELKAFTQLKTAGDAAIRRVIIIENAELMTTEAQNALLKILEEPPKDTVLILTADFLGGLLPTIRSRVRQLVVNKPSASDLINLFKTSHDEATITKTYHMSGGRIGLMHALLNESTDHPLAQQVALAKQVLSKTPYERLLMSSVISDENIELFLTALYNVAHAALKSAIEKNSEKLVRRWYHTCKVINESQNMLERKPQLKLLLTNLFINL